MQQWSAEQLGQAARSAIDKSKYQDAVSVLGYLIQNYPDSHEADQAREQYRFLTGTNFIEPDQLKPVNGYTQEEKKSEPPAKTDEVSSDAKRTPRLKPVPKSPPLIDKPTGAALEPGEEVASSPSMTSRPIQDRTPAPQQFATDDITLQKDDRGGRILADVFYGLGWILIPVGLLVLLFATAFDILLIWGFAMLISGPLLIGLGQMMWAVFEIRKANLSLQDERGTKETG